LKKVHHYAIINKKLIFTEFIMDAKRIIQDTLKKNLGLSINSITPIGKGGSGSVYRVGCNASPFILAVKISPHPELMQQEFEMLSFLKEKTKSKIPTVFCFEKTENHGIIAMEYIDGISGTDKAVKNSCRKKHLVESIIDNLLLIQQAHNDKFGPYNAAIFDTWQEYYRQFADDIYSFSQSKHSAGELDDTVMRAVCLSYQKFNIIFSEDIFPPTLIHGDYWMPNFIIDKKAGELIAAVDPFNIMWADPEYELFALTVGYGKQLRLYELYKRKVKVSKYCDLKLQMYALYSELLWYKKDVPVDHAYLKKRAKSLIKEMKKNKLL